MMAKAKEDDERFMNGLRHNANLLQGIAMFMALLVIMLPVSSSAVFAATIQRVSVSGSDEIKGVRNADDKDTIRAEVSSGIPVTNDDLQFRKGSTVLGVADSCSLQGAFYQCSYSTEQSSLPTTTSCYNYDVCVGDCNSCSGPLCRKQAKICVDSKAPTVSSVRINGVTEATSRGEDITLTYDAKDTACSATQCSGMCAGIDKIEVFEIATESASNDKLIDTIVFIGDEGCTLQAKEEAITTSPVTNGKQDICFYPIDNLGNKATAEQRAAGGPNCFTLTKDSALPSVQAARLLAGTGEQGEEGQNIAYAGRNSQVTFYLKVKGPSAFTIDSYADLTALGGQSSVKMERTDLGEGIYEFRKIHTLSLAEAATVELPVTFKDEYGKAYDDIARPSFTLDIDTDSAIFGSEDILSMFMVSGDPVLRLKDNTLVAVLNDEGAGFTGNNVWFQVNSGTKLKANCTVSDTVWICRREDVDLSGNPLSVSITVSGADDANNPIPSASRQINVDDTEPEIARVERRSSLYPALPTTVEGDTLLISLYLNDDYGIVNDPDYLTSDIPPSDVTANFGAFAASGAVPGECGLADIAEPETGEPTLTEGVEPPVEEGPKQWVCNWAVESVHEGPIKIDFVVKDAVGNKKTVANYDDISIVYVNPATQQELTLGGEGAAMQAEIYPSEEPSEDAPNYWSLTHLPPMPNFVESRLAEVMPFPIRVPLNVYTSRPSAKLAFITLNKCTGDFDSYGDMAQSYVTTIPDHQTPGTVKKNPHLIITLSKGPIDKDVLEFNCSLSLVTLHNGRLTPAEEENISISLQVNTNDELAKGVEEKRDKHLGYAKIAQGEWINSLDRVLSVLTNLCDILRAFVGIAQVIHIIGLASSWLEDSVVGTAAAQVIKVSGATTKTTDIGLWETLFIACGFISCSETLWGDWYTGWRETMRVNTAGFFVPDSPKQSIILSVATGCIPGVIQGMRRYSEVECKYVNCINEQVTAGVPLAVCSKTYNYDICKQVVGELFSVIGISMLVNMASIIQGMLKNPFSAALGISKLLCLSPPVAAKMESFFLCTTSDSVVEVLKIIEIYNSVSDTNSWGTSETECTKAFAAAEE